MNTTSEMLLGDEFTNALVRRYYKRPGAKFVDIQRVGIPVHVLKLYVLCIAKRAMPPISEFILKGIDSGVESQKELSEFFGLAERTVERTLLELYGSEMIDLVPITTSNNLDNPVFRLTMKGSELVKSLVRTTLEEKVVDDVVIHGFTRKPIAVDARTLLTAADLEQFGMLELPALPKAAPSVDQFAPDEINAAMGSKDDSKIIGVRAVLKPKKIRFVPAYLIQYQSTGGILNRGAQFAFIGMDGREDDPAEKAFRKAGGAERIEHILVPQTPGIQSAVSEYLTAEQVARIPQTSQADELRDKIDSLEASLSEEVPLAPVTSRTAELRETNASLQLTIDQLKQELSRQPVEMLRTFECGKVLRDSIANAKDRLLIVSAFLSAQVVNLKFIADIEQCLKRGVQIWIGYGFDDRGKRERYDWTDAEDALRQLRKRYKKQLILHDLKNSHEKILIVDNEYVVVGSYNWLSFQQDPRSRYRRENAVLIRQAQTINEYWEEFLKVITSAKAASQKSDVDS